MNQQGKGMSFTDTLKAHSLANQTPNVCTDSYNPEI